jgi:glycosyltransferase involved in cell wall biosynthesis
MTAQFICAFNRDRDGYQVPLALAEAHALTALVTDYYEGSSRLRVSRLRHRRVDGVAPEQVVPVFRAFAAQAGVELLKKRFGGVQFPADYIEGALARESIRQARRHSAADLLLYSGCAGDAFRAAPDRRRILFQYHPGESAVRAALNVPTDFAGAMEWIPEPELYSKRRRANYEVEITHADQFLVASSFTKQGLVNDGVDPHRVNVVPYGCPSVGSEVTQPAERLIVFLGQGVQRKGLHLLLSAWASMPHRGFRLQVISNFIDPGMRPLLDSCSDLDVRQGMSNDEVSECLARADTLVLPSLVEGFGLVLGEALAHGCRLIATPHTGLPDMGLGLEDATIVAAGMVSDVRAGLTAHIDSYDADPETRNARQAQAQRLSWAAFRDGIRHSVGLDATGTGSPLDLDTGTAEHE